MATPNTRFSTVSGAYYVGMTRNQAKNKKEFDNIDSNHNKKLEGHEICDKRDEEVRKISGDKEKTVGLLTGTSILSVPALSATGVGIPAAIGSFIILGGAAVAADIFMDDGKEALKETKKYRQKHRLDANF